MRGSGEDPRQAQHQHIAVLNLLTESYCGRSDDARCVTSSRVIATAISAPPARTIPSTEPRPNERWVPHARAPLAAGRNSTGGGRCGTLARPMPAGSRRARGRGNGGWYEHAGSSSSWRFRQEHCEWRRSGAKLPAEGQRLRVHRTVLERSEGVGRSRLRRLHRALTHGMRALCERTSLATPRILRATGGVVENRWLQPANFVLHRSSMRVLPSGCSHCTGFRSVQHMTFRAPLHWHPALVGRCGAHVVDGQDGV